MVLRVHGGCTLRGPRPCQLPACPSSNPRHAGVTVRFGEADKLKQREERFRKEQELERLKMLTKKRLEVVEKMNALTARSGGHKNPFGTPPTKPMGTSGSVNRTAERNKQLKELLDKKKGTVDLAVCLE